MKSGGVDQKEITNEVQRIMYVMMCGPDNNEHTLKIIERHTVTYAVCLDSSGSPINTK